MVRKTNITFLPLDSINPRGGIKTGQRLHSQSLFIDTSTLPKKSGRLKILAIISALLVLLYPLLIVLIPVGAANLLHKHLGIDILTIDSLLGTLGAGTLNTIKQDADGRTTVLVIGIDRGKERHYTFNTDTIISITYDHKSHKVFMISYPRDLYVRVPNTRRTFSKINAIYWYGKRLADDGVGYLKKTIKEISGLDVQYYLIVDFDGFRKLIDELGGITVYNPNAFVDYYFPDGQGGYKTVRFEKGALALTGGRALEYARSRKAAGVEGTDFARARRQQRIIEALSQKLAQRLKENPTFITRLYELLNQNFEYSPVSIGELTYLAHIYLNKGMPNIYSLVLQPQIGNFRLLKSYELPLYIVAPRHGLGEWYFVRLFVQDFLKYPDFITNLPTKIETVRCTNSATYSRELKLLRSRLFYIPINDKTYKYKQNCPNTNSLEAPPSYISDIQTLTGYSPLSTQSSVPQPIFYITSYSLNNKWSIY